MKRLLLSCVAVLATLTSTQAQTAYAESGLWDNWYVGANVGFNSKLTHNPFFSHLNPHLTLRAGKDIIPIVGVMAEFTTFFDDKQFPAENIDGNFIYSHTAIKAFNFDVLGNLNLHNLFKGYLGYQRPFEARFIAGIGLNHVCGIHSTPKFGFDFVFSLDKYVRVKGLEAYVEPALNYNLTRYNSGVQFNPNCAAWQLAIGVNYHLDALRKRPKKTASKPTYTPATEPVVSVTTTITPRTEQNPTTAPALTPKKEPITYTPSKVEYPKPDPITYNRDKAKVEPAKAAPAKVEPAKVEPAKVEPAKVEPAKVEPAKVEPAKVEPAKVEPAKVEPVKTAPAKAKPVKTKNAKAKSGKKRKAAPAKQATPAATPAKQTTPAVAPAKQATPATTPKDLSDLPAIHFNPADNIIPDDQYDAIAKVATYMKSHPRAHIIIKGESAQAASVKNALTRRYGINATRLSATAGNQANLVTFAEK